MMLRPCVFFTSSLSLPTLPGSAVGDAVIAIAIAAKVVLMAWVNIPVEVNLWQAI